jgi:hypothetical protein
LNRAFRRHRNIFRARFARSRVPDDPTPEHPRARRISCEQPGTLLPTLKVARGPRKISDDVAAELANGRRWLCSKGVGAARKHRRGAEASARKHRQFQTSLLVFLLTQASPRATNVESSDIWGSQRQKSRHARFQCRRADSGSRNIEIPVHAMRKRSRQVAAAIARDVDVRAEGAGIPCRRTGDGACRAPRAEISPRSRLFLAPPAPGSPLRRAFPMPATVPRRTDKILLCNTKLNCRRARLSVIRA